MPYELYKGLTFTTSRIGVLPKENVERSCASRAFLRFIQRRRFMANIYDCVDDLCRC